MQNTRSIASKKQTIEKSNPKNLTLHESIPTDHGAEINGERL
jgi:hypothetical protein